MDLLEKINRLEKFIGNTPVLNLSFGPVNVFAKIEYYNFTGSVKDRAAIGILKDAIVKGKIDSGTTIVESTSGNFGFALAGICNQLQIDFIPVIDPNISSHKEKKLEMFSREVVKVSERDETGGYLLNRIKVVKQLIKDIPNSFHPNQYENEQNFLAYYNSLGIELNDSFNRIDYVFAAVSSGGTIAGVSLRIKEKFPQAKVVAVDIEGSLIFNSIPKRRHISGLGASLRTPIIDRAVIDEVMILTEEEIVAGCKELLNEQGMFAGGSSGAVYKACKKKFANEPGREKNVVLIFPDDGNGYMETIYNPAWVQANITEKYADPVTEVKPI